MHIFLVLWVIIASIIWGDWKNWERYYPTMLYIACMGLLYMYISSNSSSLWIIERDRIISGTTARFIHTFLINPLSAFLFLSNYPDGHKKTWKLLHYLKWSLIFIVIESIGHYLGLITYHNGWNLGWSLFFIIIMFPMLRLHYYKKIIAIPLSVFWILFYLIVMDYF